MSTYLFTVMNALGELASAYLVADGFIVYSKNFGKPPLGFAINFYFLAEWIVSLSLELVVASITIKYRNVRINTDAWVAIIFVAIAVVNMFDVKSYGETEVVLSMIKILAILGFSILGIVLICGGGL